MRDWSDQIDITTHETQHMPSDIRNNNEHSHCNVGDLGSRAKYGPCTNPLDIEALRVSLSWTFVCFRATRQPSKQRYRKPLVGRSFIWQRSRRAAKRQWQWSQRFRQIFTMIIFAPFFLFNDYYVLTKTLAHSLTDWWTGWFIIRLTHICVCHMLFLRPYVRFSRCSPSSPPPMMLCWA